MVNPGKRYTEEERAEMCRLRLLDHTLDEIARMTGASVKTVFDVTQHLGVRLNMKRQRILPIDQNPEAIAGARALVKKWRSEGR